MKFSTKFDSYYTTEKPACIGVCPTHKVLDCEGSRMSYRCPNDMKKIGNCLYSFMGLEFVSKDQQTFWLGNQRLEK